MLKVWDNKWILLNFELFDIPHLWVCSWWEEKYVTIRQGNCLINPEIWLVGSCSEIFGSPILYQNRAEKIGPINSSF